MELANILTAGVELNGGLKVVVLTLVWLVAVGLGVWEYSRSKGRIGRALMVTLGGGLLITFVVSPSILTEDIPTIFESVLDWLTGAAKQGGK